MKKPGDANAALLLKGDIEREVKLETALTMKVAGASFREIGRMFAVSGATAKKWVTAAQQRDQLNRARGIIGERLVPKALAVYDLKLEQGDLEAARDVLFGAGVLNKTQKVTVGVEDPLERFRQKYFGESSVDGEVVANESVE